MPEKSLLTNLKQDTQQKKSLRNHALDEYNATRKLLQSPITITKVSTDKSLTRPVTAATSEVTDILPLESWLIHSTNADSKERCHLWNLQDGIITLFMSNSKTLFFKQIPTSTIKDVKLLKNGAKLKVKLNSGLLMMVTSSSNSRSFGVLKPWFVKLSQTLHAQDDLEDTAVADNKSVEQISGVFSNVQFALDFGNATSGDKADLRNLIKKNGGQISYIFTKNTRYFVCGIQKDFYKSQRAAKLGIPIVSKEFLKECVAKGKLLPAPKSEEDLKAVKDEFAKGKISIYQKENTKEDVKEFCIDTLKRYKLDDSECLDFSEEYHVAKFAFLSLDETESLVCIEAHIAADKSDHIEYGYRIMISVRLHDEKTRRFFYFVDDASRLCQCYEAVIVSYIEDCWEHQVDIMELENIGDVPSEKLSSLLEEMKISKGSLHRDVENLVASIWHDSLGELANCDIVPDDVTLHDVCNAMIALLKIEQALRNNSEFQHLSKEYYKHIRRKNMKMIDTIQAVAKEREACQILKDVVCVKENLWNTKNIPSSILQYSSLNCVIRHVDKAHAEYKSVLDLFPSKNEINYDIINVYRVNRNVEDIEFCADIKNKKLLFHSSGSSNIVSILSRGLIMPSKVSDELGIPRSDEGYLGHGIYFSDSFAMSSKYTNVSASRGSRLMFIHEVALGDAYETDKKMSQLMAPPSGFQSVMGVNLGDDSRSGNEFVVYNVNQQRMRYLIEFTLKEEHVYSNSDIAPLSIFKSPKDVPVPETPEYSEPVLKQVEFGLVSSKKNSVNLEEFHVRGKIVDLVAEVTVFQVYRNNFNSNIEGKYVFPLEENVAVCGFEAYINEKHVIGEVKEKEQARKEYKKAVAEGHGAYLMEEEEPRIFSLSLGNIPAHAKVVIKIKYVCELETINDPDCCVLFSLPKNLANWKEDSTLIDGLPTQVKTDSMKVTQNAKKTSFMVSIDMPYDIHEIKSPTHCISWKKTATKACVKLSKSASLLQKNLRLLIRVAEIHVPRIWVEQNDEMSSSEVAMVTFFPEFDFNARDDYQCTILLDMSCSMSGKSCSYAKFITKSIIHALPAKSKFNVIMFGSYFKELFVAYEHASDNMKEKALEMLSQCEPNLGGSDLTHVFGSLYLLLSGAEKHDLHNVFLISDGHVTDEERILRLASKISTASSSQTRFFTYAVGDMPNNHFLRKMCTVSGGRFEHFLPTIKHTWSGQIENQLRCAKQPVLTDVHIEWCNYEVDNNDTSIFTNVPEKPKCIFSGSRMTAYSFLPNCSKATLHARIMGAEVSTVVTVNSLSKITGKTLHYLAAKAVFNEYDTGNLADDAFVNQIYHEQKKSFITSLSIKHSVVCKFTSFIAVEKRERGEDMSITTGPTMEELLKSSFIDEITEVSWEGLELSIQDRIDELLKRCRQYETSSILQAREFAQDAAKLCEKLSDEPLKKLLVSANCFRLGIEYNGLSPKQVLDRVLLKRRTPNFEIVNEITKSEDSSYSKALEELIRLSWATEDTVQLMSFVPQSLRPIFISGFQCAFQARPPSDDIQTDFWKYMRDIDMEQDSSNIMRSVARASAELYLMNGMQRYQNTLLQNRLQSTSLLRSTILRKSSIAKLGDKVHSSFPASIASRVSPQAPANNVARETESECLERSNLDRGLVRPARRDKSDPHVRKSALDQHNQFPPAYAQRRQPPQPRSSILSISRRKKCRLPESSAAPMLSSFPAEQQNETSLPPPVPPRDVSSDAGMFTERQRERVLPLLASDMMHPDPTAVFHTSTLRERSQTSQRHTGMGFSSASTPPPVQRRRSIRRCSAFAPQLPGTGVSCPLSSPPPMLHRQNEEMLLSTTPRRARRSKPMIRDLLELRSIGPPMWMKTQLSDFEETDSLVSALSGETLKLLSASNAVLTDDSPANKEMLLETSPQTFARQPEPVTRDLIEFRSISPPELMKTQLSDFKKTISLASASSGETFEILSASATVLADDSPANKEMFYASTEANLKANTVALDSEGTRGSDEYRSAAVTKRVRGRGTVSAHVIIDRDNGLRDEHVQESPPPLPSKSVVKNVSRMPAKGTLFGSVASPLNFTEDSMRGGSFKGAEFTVESERKATSKLTPERVVKNAIGVRTAIADLVESSSCDSESDSTSEVSSTADFDDLSSSRYSFRRLHDGGAIYDDSCPSLHTEASYLSRNEIQDSIAKERQTYDCFHSIAGDELKESEDDDDMGAVLQSSPSADKIHVTSVARLAAELQNTDLSLFQPNDNGDIRGPTKHLIITTIEQVLTEAGGKSLGERCFSECVEILFLSVGIILLDHISEEDAELRDLETKELMETWKSQVKLSDDKYPLLYDRLELGKSWNEAAHFIIELVCKKLAKHTPGN